MDAALRGLDLIVDATEVMILLLSTLVGLFSLNEMLLLLCKSKLVGYFGVTAKEI